jgi:putative ABC transport system permease protein
MTVVVRTPGDPAALAGAVAAAIHSVDKEQPVLHVMPMTGYIARTVGRQRFSMTLYGIFGVLSLLLAAVGVYGVSAYNVSQLNHQIGIRIAIGARPGDVVRLVVGGNAMLVAAGLATGTIAALALTRWLASQLFGITARDPLTFGIVVTTLAAVALLACWLPARRSTRIDPAVALRYE